MFVPEFNVITSNCLFEFYVINCLFEKLPREYSERFQKKLKNCRPVQYKEFELPRECSEYFVLQINAGSPNYPERAKLSYALEAVRRNEVQHIRSCET